MHILYFILVMFGTHGCLFSMLRAGQAIELPFSLYSTFVIEARHGFNKVSLILYYQISPSFYGCAMVSILRA